MSAQLRALSGQERTAANAHAEGEYAALDILRAVDGKVGLPPFVAPPRLCAISLGKWDGVVVLGRWVALRGLLAAVVKAFLQFYFVHFLPLPYWLMRRLPGRQPRRYGGSAGALPDMQLARTGGSGLVRGLGRRKRAASSSMRARKPAMRAAWPSRGSRGGGGGGGGAFVRLLASVTLSPLELACIDSARTRTVLRAAGVIARGEAPAVRSGFEVIYQDFPILRPAGDFAVRRLASECAVARKRAITLTELTGTTAPELVPTLRRYFEAIDVSRTGALELGDLEAACSGEAGTFTAVVALVCLEEECALDDDADGVEPGARFTGASFADFVRLVTQRPTLRADLARLAPRDEGCLLEAESIGLAIPPGEAQQHASRFDDMLARVLQWEQAAAVATLLDESVGGRRGRLRTILRGCFDGARRAEVGRPRAPSPAPGALRTLSGLVPLPLPCASTPPARVAHC